jgi:hypothetical protein
MLLWHNGFIDLYEGSNPSPAAKAPKPLAIRVSEFFFIFQWFAGVFEVS